MKALALPALLVLIATPAQAQTPQAAFFDRLSALCGKSFAGKVVTNDPADAAFAGKPLVMHVKTCTPDEVRIPFHVGEDQSRTWVVTRTTTGLRLKHDHRHEDGTQDAVSQYGGDTTAPGTASRQEFPVDQVSKDLFVRENRAVSVTNVWAMEVEPGQVFAYELRRPGRHFRVEFDLAGG
ncbi:hypothetical protein [Phenylobacterium sp.]|uniref:hypothetical protein n=1 Tax=Phenylobacterium sp. TaxID=1871053 RepID=UPI00273265CB|nr:hypothetical protein [Phenylobacterium sp.]MDP3852676.1 hypothetical protein [Phenylobacterium sp.]